MIIQTGYWFLVPRTGASFGWNGFQRSGWIGFPRNFLLHLENKYSFIYNIHFYNIICTYIELNLETWKFQGDNLPLNFFYCNNSLFKFPRFYLFLIVFFSKRTVKWLKWFLVCVLRCICIPVVYPLYSFPSTSPYILPTLLQPKEI